jgi:glycylpeptide N-tetradecanoyltransferase
VTEAMSGIRLAQEAAAGAVAAEPAKKSKNALKKAKQKAKKAGGGGGGGGGASSQGDEGASASGAGAPEDDEESKRAMIEALVGRMKAAGGTGKPKEHKFWDTQPVPKIGEEGGEFGKQLDVEKSVEDIKADEYKMPAGFVWCEIDIKSEVEVNEMYNLLTENYVEDDDNMFRFDYSIPFLKWALEVPNYVKNWHVGVRSEKSGKLMACITGVPAAMRCYEDQMNMAEINFLCIHKKLRAKRLAPMLIKEVTRRINLTGIFQAVYTAGVVLPKPIASCRYWHRSLNPKKLIEVGFSRLAPRMTMARTIKLYKTNDQPHIPNIRKMLPADVPSAHKLLAHYLGTNFNLATVFSEEEFAHWFLPRDGVVDCYVVSDESGTVTDLCSYYHLPSSIIGHEKHETLFAAYSFYNVATTVKLQTLMDDCMHLAQKNNFDVFNALDIMQNSEFLKNLKFGIGDGHLQYYLYNWRCADMTSENVGLVLL